MKKEFEMGADDVYDMTPEYYPLESDYQQTIDALRADLAECKAERDRMRELVKQARLLISHRACNTIGTQDMITSVYECLRQATEPPKSEDER
jgi:hypothetical protein